MMLKTAMPAVRYRPIWMLVTCVATPAMGARSTVLARSRLARSRATVASMYWGYLSSGSATSPSNWLRATASCCTNCSSSDLEAISNTRDLSRSEGVLMRLLSSEVLRSKSA